MVLAVFLSFAVFCTNLAGGASSLLLTGDGSRRRFSLDFTFSVSLASVSRFELYSASVAFS